MREEEFSKNDKIEKYLEELSVEYKTLLFKALIEQSPSVDDLSVSELLRLDSEIKKPLLSDYRHYTRKRKMVFLVGLSYFLIGLLGFLFYLLYKQIMSASFDKDSMIALLCSLMSFVGLITCGYSFFVPRVIKHEKSTFNKKQASESTALLEYEIISKWRDVEGLVSDFSVSSQVRTATSAINYLKQNGMIDATEQDTLKKLLRLRNEVVHSGNKPISVDDAKNLLKQTDQVLDKLKTVLQ